MGVWGPLCCSSEAHSGVQGCSGEFGGTSEATRASSGRQCPSPGHASGQQDSGPPPSHPLPTASPLPPGHRQTCCLLCSPTLLLPVFLAAGSAPGAQGLLSVLFMAVRPPPRSGQGLASSWHLESVCSVNVLHALGQPLVHPFIQPAEEDSFPFYIQGPVSSSLCEPLTPMARGWGDLFCGPEGLPG